MPNNTKKPPATETRQQSSTTPARPTTATSIPQQINNEVIDLTDRLTSYLSKASSLHAIRDRIQKELTTHCSRLMKISAGISSHLTERQALEHLSNQATDTINKAIETTLAQKLTAIEQAINDIQIQTDIPRAFHTGPQTTEAAGNNHIQNREPTDSQSPSIQRQSTNKLVVSSSSQTDPVHIFQSFSQAAAIHTPTDVPNTTHKSILNQPIEPATAPSNKNSKPPSQQLLEPLEEGEIPTSQTSSPLQTQDNNKTKHQSTTSHPEASTITLRLKPNLPYDSAKQALFTCYQPEHIRKTKHIQVLPNGDLRMECYSTNRSSPAHQLNTNPAFSMFQVNPNPTPPTHLFIYSTPDDINSSQLQTAITANLPPHLQHSARITRLRSFPSRYRGRNWTFKASPAASQFLQHTKIINIYNTPCSITKRHTITTCTNCWDHNAHNTTDCPRVTYCGRCSEEYKHHKGSFENCQKPTRCLNCKLHGNRNESTHTTTQQAHPASSPTCPIYKQALAQAARQQAGPKAPQRQVNQQPPPPPPQQQNHFQRIQRKQQPTRTYTRPSATPLLPTPNTSIQGKQPKVTFNNKAWESERGPIRTVTFQPRREVYFSSAYANYWTMGNLPIV